MATMSVSLRNLPGTEAAVGWAGSHTVVIDRAEDRAGGMGLGFNGGQMIALAIGGCFCNDLRYVAHEMGISILALEVDVEITLEGSPLLVTGATLRARVETDGDATELLRRAEADSTVSNSVRQGFPVTVMRNEAGAG